MCGKRMVWKNKLKVTEKLHKKSLICLLIIVVTALFAMHEGHHIGMILKGGKHHQPDQHGSEHHRPDHHRPDHKKPEHHKFDHHVDERVSQVKLMSVDGRHLEEVQNIAVEEPVASDDIETEVSEGDDSMRGRRRGHGRKGKGKKGRRGAHGRNSHKRQKGLHRRQEGPHRRQEGPHRRQEGPHRRQEGPHRRQGRHHEKDHENVDEHHVNKLNHKKFDGPHQNHHNASHHNGTQHR
jgi:hypothetical protein